VNVLDEMRPRAEHLDDEQSARLLREVLLSPPEAPRRRWKPRVAALTLAGAIVVGGTAYAGGLVPHIVSDRFHEITEGSDGWDRPITNERLLVKTTLSDGTPIRIWRADTPGGLCQIADTTGHEKRPGDFGVSCALWNPPERLTPDIAGVLQACAGHPALVFGQLRKPWLDVRSVKAHAGGPDVTIPIDRSTHVFAGEVPASPQGVPMTIDYLDGAGKIVGTDREEFGVDSDTENCPGS
jgi:hypothetical protein